MARRSARTAPDEPFVEKIVDIDVSEEMQGSFLEYAYSVIYSRALPDARDGLKPVQRRILFGMSQMGLAPERGHVKSSRVVGDVMGKLHPHGDSAIYDALVRMAQPFSMRVPLVDGHGNFGSLDDLPAAMRYCLTGDTRVRLADGSSWQIADLVDLPSDSEGDADFEVLDRDGKPVRVTKVFNSGVHPTKRLVTASGHEITGSHNHPVLCLTAPMGVPIFQWLRLDEITPGTVVCLARNVVATAIPNAEEWSLGVLLGAWVSEGFANESRAGFGNTDRDYFDHVVRAYDRWIGGRRYVSRRAAKSRRREMWTLDVQDMTAFAAGPMGETIGQLSAEKRIPDAVWTRGPGVKRAFLMSLFEGDGSITEGPGDGVCIHYSTRSDGLAKDIQELLLDFGVASTLYVNRQRDEKKVIISGRHNLIAFAEQVGFLTTKQVKLQERLRTLPRTTHRLSRDFVPYVRDYVLGECGPGRGTGKSWIVQNNIDRTERWAQNRSLIISKLKNEEVAKVVVPIMDSSYRFVTVKTIEDAAPVEVYSLRVDSDDHSFLAGGFVNHNTECRMAPTAVLMTTSLDEDVVDFRPNYDDRETEPTVLPAAFPNLLVNGAAGIAVGMATNMAPHNLGEVVAATRHLIKHPNASLDDLMRFVPGPDLPTGGKIVGLDGIREAYETGKGAFRTRATARIENVTARKKGIVVTELPYNVGPERVIEKISDLVKSKKLQGISDITDLTDGEHGLQVVIEVKNGFHPEAILEQLYRLTPMEDSFNINNVALVEGQPRTLGLRELLAVYVDHRLDVVRRRCEFRRRKALDRAHIVEGLLIALDAIDDVIHIIRSSADVPAAKERLIEAFELSDVQAQHILDMQLRRLAALEVTKLRDELAALQATIAELTRILEDDALLRTLVSDELAEVAKKHATPRRTVLLESSGATTTAAAVPLEVSDDPCHVLLSSTGLLARTADAEPLLATGERAKHDVVVSAVTTTARGEVGVVTSRGRAIRLSALELPALPATASAPSLAGGGPLSEFVSLDAGERAVALMAIDADAPTLAVGTALGVVKRVVADVPSNRDSWDVMSLKDGDEVVGAVSTRTEDDLLVFVTNDAQLLHFPASAVRPQGRAAGGMAGIRLAPKARAVFFGAITAGDPGPGTTEPVVVTVAGSYDALPGTEPGTAKVTPFVEYPGKGRATGGVRCHRLLKGEDGLVLGWVGTGPARAASANGVPVDLPEPVDKRDGSGVPLPQAIAAVAGPAAP